MDDRIQRCRELDLKSVIEKMVVDESLIVNKKYSKFRYSNKSIRRILNETI